MNSLSRILLLCFVVMPLVAGNTSFGSEDESSSNDANADPILDDSEEEENLEGEEVSQDDISAQDDTDEEEVNNTDNEDKEVQNEEGDNSDKSEISKDKKKNKDETSVPSKSKKERKSEKEENTPDISDKNDDAKAKKEDSTGGSEAKDSSNEPENISKEVKEFLKGIKAIAGVAKIKCFKDDDTSFTPEEVVYILENLPDSVKKIILTIDTVNQEIIEKVKELQETESPETDSSLPKNLKEGIEIISLQIKQPINTAMLDLLAYIVKKHKMTIILDGGLNDIQQDSITLLIMNSIGTGSIVHISVSEESSRQLIEDLQTGLPSQPIIVVGAPPPIVQEDGPEKKRESVE